MQNRIKSIAYIVTLFGLSALHSLNAQNHNLKLDTINLTLSGVVTEKTCGVLSTEQDKYVPLGSIRVGQSMLKGDRSPLVPIRFEMSSCPANGAVTITFTGSKDSVDTELLAIDNIANKAKNVAIEISDKNKKRLALGKKSPPLSTDVNGNATALFYANYLVTQGAAEVGKANAKMQFSVEYE